MKQYTTPGLKETREILYKQYRKSPKYLGRAQLEAIKAKLEKGKRG